MKQYALIVVLLLAGCRSEGEPAPADSPPPKQEHPSALQPPKQDEEAAKHEQERSAQVHKELQQEQAKRDETKPAPAEPAKASIAAQNSDTKTQETREQNPSASGVATIATSQPTQKSEAKGEPVKKPAADSEPEPKPDLPPPEKAPAKKTEPPKTEQKVDRSIGYAWVQPALEGDAWSSLNPHEGKVGNAIMCVCMLGSDRIHSIAITPIDQNDATRGVFINDRRGVPIPLVLSGEDVGDTYDGHTVQYFSLEHLLPALRSGATLRLEIELESGAGLKVVQNDFQPVTSTGGKAEYHSFCASTGRLKMGVHKERDNSRNWTIVMDRSQHK